MAEDVTFLKIEAVSLSCTLLSCSSKPAMHVDRFKFKQFYHTLEKYYQYFQCCVILFTK